MTPVIDAFQERIRERKRFHGCKFNVGAKLDEVRAFNSGLTHLVSKQRLNRNHQPGILQGEPASAMKPDFE